MAVFCAVSISVVANLRPSYTSIQKGSLQSEKHVNGLYRLQIWRATLRMIRDNPLGIGYGRFSSVFPFYKKNTVKEPEEGMADQSPHQEFLRIWAEDGTIVFLIITALGVGLALQVAKSVKRGILSTSEKHLVVAVFGYLFVEACFQFPLLNALPTLMFAAVIGFLLSRLYRRPTSDAQGTYQRQPLVTAALAGLSLLYLAVAMGEAYAAYIEVNRPNDFRQMNWACLLAPSQGRVCVRSAILKYEHGQKNEAEKKLLDHLAYFPYDMLNINYLFEMYLDQGELKKACRWMKVYDDVYNEKSGVHSIIEARCGNMGSS